jgi:AcrR family transcriptional regulator
VPTSSVPGRGRYDRASSASQRARARRALVCETALQLLAESLSSLPQINIDELCRRAHLGRSAVYGLFETAHELAQRVLDEAQHELLRVLPSPTAVETPLDSVTIIATAWLNAATANPASLTALLRWRRAGLRADLHNQLQTRIARGVQAGAFAATSSAIRLPLIVEAFLAAADPELRPANADAAQWAAALAELTLRTLR